MKKITLVGCGNIGSRHLQALTKLPFEVEVNVIEPNIMAQAIAKSRLDEIPSKEMLGTFNWHKSISDFSGKSDLAIVATNAFKRIDLIQKLVEKGNSRFLIEKMVCQSTNEYDHLLSLLKSFKAKGWVNTTRRYFQSYQKIKNYFQKSKMIQVLVNAGNIGLGSNAIHFVDLFSWLTDDHEIFLNGDYLLNKIFPNERGKDLLEFAGTILGSSKKGSFLSISFLPYDDVPTTVGIFGNNGSLLINETSEKIYNLSNSESDLKFHLELQSNLTTQIASNILKDDDCLLPTIKDSYFAHKELFRIFNEHIRKLTNKTEEQCPIT